MEISTKSSKMVRQRLGSILLDLHYKPETVFAIIKPGNDDYAAIICNPQWLRDQGVEIPELKKESKPSKKK